MRNIDSLFLLKNKVAIVTGGAVNIGRAISETLALAGAKVAVVYHHSRREAEDLSKELNSANIDNMIFQADLCDENQVIKMINAVVEHFGKIDVLVNNSGIFSLSLQHELDAKNWDEVFDLNLKGLFLCTREVLKSMMKKGDGGVIVNIASINGLHPGFGQTAHYDATKGGVIAYTKSLAAEVAGSGIRVVAVAPGLVDSENLRKYAPQLAETVEKRTPLKKIGKPGDVANAVLFLASEAASHITGEIVTVDGGYLLS
jgi:3-oxoacyl-[acyl-carrier protein] reductase